MISLSAVGRLKNLGAKIQNLEAKITHSKTCKSQNPEKP